METLTGGCYLTTIEGFRIMYISLSSTLPSPPPTDFAKSCHNYFDILVGNDELLFDFLKKIVEERSTSLKTNQANKNVKCEINSTNL